VGSAQKLKQVARDYCRLGLGYGWQAEEGQDEGKPQEVTKVTKVTLISKCHVCVASFGRGIASPVTPAPVQTPIQS
jgi:hypothetical protein